MTKLKYILYTLIFIVSFVSCSKSPMITTSPIDIETDEASLSLKISLADFNTGIPDVTTRALTYSERLAKIDNDDIHSLAVFLMKEEGENKKIVAYRIFLDETSAGHDKKYFFKNINNFKREDNPLTAEDESLEDIPDIPITDVLTGVITKSEAAINFQNGGDDSDLVNAFEIDVKTGNPLCGINRINADNKTAEIHFDYMYPLHGDMEKLHPGKYHLIMYANFRESPSFFEGFTLGEWIKESIGYWLRHEYDGDFDGISPNAVNDEYAKNGIYRGFALLATGRMHLSDATVLKINTEVDSNTGIILPSHDDIITSPSYMRNVESDLVSTFAGIEVLAHGDNQHNLQLLRTVSRATFNIKNQGCYPIKINSFSLSNNFSSAATYLIAFRSNINSPLKNSQTWIGAPNVTSERAILKFDNTIEYPASSPATPFFDALLLDVWNEDQLRYTIDIEIPSVISGEGHLPNEEVQTITMMNDALSSSEWEVGTGRLFLIRSNVTAVSGHSGKQMFIKYNGVYVDVDKDGSDNATEYTRISTQVQEYDRKDVMWEFIKVSSTEIKIKNVSNNKFIFLQGESESGNRLLFTEDINEASVFTLHNYKGNTNAGVSDANIPTNAVAFTSNTTSEVYLNILQGTGECVSCKKWNDWGSHFFIYPVTTYPQTLHKKLDIPVIAYDSNLGNTYPLYYLHRNEHLNVQIMVSFNEHYQDIEIEPLAFTKKVNTIDFH